MHPIPLRMSSLALAAVMALASPLAAQQRFLRGDADGNGVLEITDPIHILESLFTGRVPPLTCPDAADVDDSGEVGLADSIRLLNYLFDGGRAPADPFGTCDFDPTDADAIGCLGYKACFEDCGAEVEAIALESAIVGSSSAVLWFGAEGIRGWQLIQGPYARPADPPVCDCVEACGDEALLDSRESPAILIQEWAGPGSRRTTVTSTRTGLTLLCRTRSADGTGAGEILYPDVWRSPETLGEYCEPLLEETPLYGHDLEGPGSPSFETLQFFQHRLWQTALPEGLETSNSLLDTAVIRARPAGGGEWPSEWFVILNAGWIE